MKRSCRLLFALPLMLSLPWSLSLRAADESGMKVAAPAKKAVTHFAAPDSIDCLKILTPPPAPGTLSGLADLEAVLQIQAARTPDQVTWAKLVDRNDLTLFADLLGNWFNEKNLPGTAAFLKDVDEDRREATDAVKKVFARARPWVIDARIQPCVGKPTNDSYPSGHTTSIFTRAGVLAEIMPEKRDELFAFAHRAAWGRVYGGVHFPSDLVGGWTLAAPFVEQLKKSPAFQEQIKKSKAEIAAYLKK
jgi:acid phosphatase (class A)